MLDVIAPEDGVIRRSGHAKLFIMSSLSFQDLGLNAAVLRAVKKKALKEGKTAPEYLRWLIERDLLANETFDEILEPIRADFRKARVTEDELDQIVDRARSAARRKKSRTRR